MNKQLSYAISSLFMPAITIPPLGTYLQYKSYEYLTDNQRDVKFFPAAGSILAADLVGIAVGTSTFALVSAALTAASCMLFDDISEKVFGLGLAATLLTSFYTGTSAGVYAYENLYDYLSGDDAHSTVIVGENPVLDVAI